MSHLPTDFQEGDELAERRLTAAFGFGHWPGIALRAHGPASGKAEREEDAASRGIARTIGK